RAEGADLSVSARYDLVAEALDAKLALVRTNGIGNGNIARPEIAVSLQGSIDSPRRTLDIAGLVDWLSTRAIAENTKRLAAMSAAADARAVESPQTQPPAARHTVPANPVAVAKPVAPPEEKTDAAAIPSNVAKPEPAATAVAAAKPETPANPAAPA